MTQTQTAVTNGKNDESIKILKGVDGIIVDNARALLTADIRKPFRRLIDDFCTIKDDGTIHCVLRGDYLQFIKQVVCTLTTIDSTAFDDDSNGLFKKVVTLAINSCAKLKQVAVDRSSDLNSWRSQLASVGVVTFIKQFILAYMHITNKAIVEYNQKFSFVDADTLVDIKRKNNFAMWQAIRTELNLIDDDDAKVEYITHN